MPHQHQKRRRIWRFVFVLHLYGFLALLSGFAFLGISGVVIWKVPAARRWAHKEVIGIYVRKIAPKLPFQIDDVQAEAKWSEFLRGKIADFAVTLSSGAWTFSLAGPIEIRTEYLIGETEKHFRGSYSPVVQIFPPEVKSKKKHSKIPPIPIELEFLADADFSHLDLLKIGTHLKSWSWGDIHLELKDFVLAGSWQEGKASIQCSAKSVEVANEAIERDLRISGFDFNASTPLRFMPFGFGPELQFKLTAAGGETNHELTRIVLPLKKFPVTGSVLLGKSEDSISISAGSGNTPPLTIEARLKKLDGETKQVSAQWRAKEFSLKEVASVLLAMTQAGDLSAFNKVSGTLETNGSATFELPMTEFTANTARIDAEIDAKNISFEWPDNYLAVSGLNLKLPVSNTTGIKGIVSADKILFRRLNAKLGPTELFLWPEDPDMKHFRLHIGSTGNNVPLSASGTPVKIGNLDGTIRLPEKKGGELGYDLGTSFRLEDTEVAKLMEVFCVKADHVPPSKLAVDFSDIELGPGSIDPTGHIHATFFGGFLDIDSIAAYALDTTVPEFDFNLNMDGVKLSELGQWSGFGEMDGILKAYAHNVVFQASLPTQYDFKLQVSPLSHPRVVFSPEAMKNVGKLVASNSIDSMPGIARWMAFGGVTRFLLGDFGVWFAGIEMFSHDGSILVETLGPPDVPPDLVQEQKQNHYVLYGRRFKIPMATPHYPIVVDAPAVSNALHRMAEQIIGLRQKKNAKEKQNARKQMDCSPPTL
jgi:hypothetical protein